MPAYFDRQKGRWRFTFNRVIDGKRNRSSRLLPKAWGRGQAEAYDRKQTGKLYAIASGIEKPTRLIDDAVALYLKHKVPHQKSGHQAELTLASTLPYYEGRPVSDLAAIAREYAESGHSSGTIYVRLQYLKTAVRYAWKHHWRDGPDPTSLMMIPPANNQRQVYITVPQLAVLLAAFDDDEARDLFKMAFYTGLRWRAELLPRQPEDVRLVAGQRWLYVGMTKNGTPRMVPIHPAIRTAMRRLPFTGAWRTYYEAFERARAKVGMGYLHAHDLRHSLASAIISQGGTLSDVGAALHHQSAESSKRYAHLYPSRLLTVIKSVS